MGGVGGAAIDRATGHRRVCTVVHGRLGAGDIGLRTALPFHSPAFTTEIHLRRSIEAASDCWHHRSGLMGTAAATGDNPPFQYTSAVWSTGRAGAATNICEGGGEVGSEG